MQSRQPHAVGVLQQQVLAGDRELALRGQALHGVRHQLRSVAQNGDGPPGGKLRELLAQLLGHERAVIGQAGHLIVRIKAGGVDLAAARVQRRAQDTAAVVQVKGKSLQRGDRHTGLLQHLGHPLDGGDADAQAGERAGPHRDGKQVDVLHRLVAAFQQRLRHRHDGLAVGEPGVGVKLRDRPVVLQQSAGSRGGGSVHRENLHIGPP